jgi:uncharacterized protein
MAKRHRGKSRCIARQDHSRPIRKGASRGRTPVSSAGRQNFRPSQSVDSKRFFEEVKAIVDTGFLVAFGNRSDYHHAWAVQLAQQVSEPLLTCEAVLAETAFHLGDASLPLDFVRTGLVQPAFTLADHLSRITELATKYRERQPDLADLCLIRMSELHPKHAIVTTDTKDFRVYRRNRREAIPLILPPR